MAAAACPRATHHPRTPARFSAHAGLRRGKTRAAVGIGIGTDRLTGLLVEQAASFAIRQMLHSCGAVETRVFADAAGLLRGEVQGVRVSGERWLSPQGLSCRTIEAEVSRAAIDVLQVLLRQRIVLSNIPTGTARVTFTADDFGAFLTHPLVRGRCLVGDAEFRFQRDAVSISPESSSVDFFGTWLRTGQRYACRLTATGSRVNCTARLLGSSPTADTENAVVGRGVTRFFSELLVDLQGAELTFASMAVTSTHGVPLLDLRLRLRVREFPPLSVRF